MGVIGEKGDRGGGGRGEKGKRRESGEKEREKNKLPNLEGNETFGMRTRFTGQRCQTSRMLAFNPNT